MTWIGRKKNDVEPLVVTGYSWHETPNILLRMGYRKNGYQSYVKNVSNIKRFHVYVMADRIELHADETRINSKGKKFHVAMIKGCKGEIKEFRLQFRPMSNKKKSILNRRECKARGLKDEALPISKIKELLKELKGSV